MLKECHRTFLAAFTVVGLVRFWLKNLPVYIPAYVSYEMTFYHLAFMGGFCRGEKTRVAVEGF